MKNTAKLIQDSVDFLTQANYNHNRKLGETPERLALVFGKQKVEMMEKNFFKTLTTAQK